MGIVVPDCVLTKVPTQTPFDNQYFRHAEDAWKRLTEIRENKISYINDDYSLLINTIERFYKGMILYCHTNDDIPTKYTEAAMTDLLTRGHRLTKLVMAIENSFGFQLFNCPTQNDIKERNTFLNKLTHAYTAARYSENYSYEDFCRTYDFVKIQKDRIYECLQPTEEKAYHQMDEFDYDKK